MKDYSFNLEFPPKILMVCRMYYVSKYVGILPKEKDFIKFGLSEKHTKFEKNLPPGLDVS